MIFPPSLVWRTENRTGLVRLRTILGLDCEKMTVGWTYGRFMVASLPRTGLFSDSYLVCCPCCCRRVLYYLGSHSASSFPWVTNQFTCLGDAGCGLSHWVSKFSRRAARAPYHCLGSAPMVVVDVFFRSNSIRASDCRHVVLRLLSLLRRCRRQGCRICHCEYSIFDRVGSMLTVIHRTTTSQITAKTTSTASVVQECVS